MKLFEKNTVISARKLTEIERNELAITLGKYELVDILIKKEEAVKRQYEHALFLKIDNEIDNCKVMMEVIDKALKYSLN